MYYKKGLYEQALVELQKAIALIPDDPVILEHLGDIHVKLKQPDKALDYYRRALSAKPDDNSLLKQKIESLINGK